LKKTCCICNAFLGDRVIIILYIDFCRLSKCCCMSSSLYEKR